MRPKSATAVVAYLCHQSNIDIVTKTNNTIKDFNKAKIMKRVFVLQHDNVSAKSG